MRHQGGIDLDRDDAPGAGQQVLGECALAGADFNNQGLIRGARRLGDALQDGMVGEEMLA
jgi:hypothetical protein